MFLENELLPDEVIVTRAKLHWITFKLTIFFSIIILIDLIPVATGEASLFEIVMGGILLIGCSYAYENIRNKKSEYLLTDKRLIAKTGIIKRKTSELLIENVEGIRVYQGWFGRLFNYGTVVVSGKGNIVEPYPYISEPFNFRRMLQHTVDKEYLS